MGCGSSADSPKVSGDAAKATTGTSKPANAPITQTQNGQHLAEDASLNAGEVSPAISTAMHGHAVDSYFIIKNQLHAEEKSDRIEVPQDQLDPNSSPALNVISSTDSKGAPVSESSEALVTLKSENNSADENTLYLKRSECDQVIAEWQTLEVEAKPTLETIFEIKGLETQAKLAASKKSNKFKDGGNAATETKSGIVAATTELHAGGATGVGDVALAKSATTEADKSANNNQSIDTCSDDPDTDTIVNVQSLDAQTESVASTTSTLSEPEGVLIAINNINNNSSNCSSELTKEGVQVSSIILPTPSEEKSITSSSVAFSGCVSEDICSTDKKLAKQRQHSYLDPVSGSELSGASNSKSGESEVDVPKVKTEKCMEALNAQKNFDTVMRTMCELVRENDVINFAKNNVRSLRMSRGLPPGINLTCVLNRLQNLAELDLSDCRMGPQAFRVIVLSLVKNISISKLNLAGNSTDTDCAACLGKLLLHNYTLEYLDVSDNYLGKDYFSRSVGLALTTNFTLSTLKFSSCGSTDLSAFIRHIFKNKTLRHIDMNNNSMINEKVLGAELSTYLTVVGCAISCLELKNCNINDEGMDMLAQGIESNKTLVSLNVSGNKFNSFQSLLSFILICVKRPAFEQLVCDNMKILDPGSIDKSSLQRCRQPSNLRSLSLASDSLNDDVIVALAFSAYSMLSMLTDVNLEGNPNLTRKSLDELFKATAALTTSGRQETSSLERLSYSSNEANFIPEILGSGRWPKLHLLNLRKAKISSENITSLSPFISRHQVFLSTLVLDGMKLSGTKALGKLLENGSSCTLVSLSLGGCSLNDDDLMQISTAIRAGLLINILKLTGNRFTDEGAINMSEALVSRVHHPLERLDLSNNKIGDDGATALSNVFQSDKHNTNIVTLLLSNNCIGKKGLCELVRCLDKPPLIRLDLNNQDNNCDEEDMTTVFYQLATTTGFGFGTQSSHSDIVVDGEMHGVLASNKGPMPLLPSGFTVNLSGLGGVPGPIGCKLDSAGIITDFKEERVPWLSLAAACQLGSYLRGQRTENCCLTTLEWNEIVSSKDAPSWLKLESARQNALYLTGLPASASVNKLEGILEMEVDCNVSEICLMKDIISKQNSGVAWILMDDEESCTRAINYYRTGEAKLFGKCFIISDIKVTIDDDVGPEMDIEQVREDIQARVAQRRKEQKAHGALILESAAASKARHEYRLLHPAYADGRIW